jgi:4'-phosphopantetheinyl transferase
MQEWNPEISGKAWPDHDGGPIPVAGNEIHLWRARLDVSPEALKPLEGLLHEDERARAGRLMFPRHRIRFIAARGILRRVLGIHTGCEPASVEFAYGEHGKPAIAKPARTGVEFNISHSGDLALYAVALDFAVGVDVELIKPDGSWLEIAGRYFAPGEYARLVELPREEMQREFFGMWAEKEARLKALGVGLHFPMEDIKGPPVTAVRFVPATGYAAALAYSRGGQTPVIVKHDFTS